MNNALHLDHVRLTKDGTSILDGVTLSLDGGEIGSLLGASGCGKTTLLRAIAGLERIDDGAITLGGRTLSGKGEWIPPGKRKVAMVFQDLALFPHLNVWQNVCFGVGFGARSGGTDKGANRIDATTAADWLERFELAALKNRLIHELSGGQQQRVALLRALLSDADLVLLDEPLSSQDNKLKERLLGELTTFLQTYQKTALMVTHHQQEALSFSDKIGILHRGRMQQWGAAFEVYHHPKTSFVADFLSRARTLKARMVDAMTLACPLGVLKLSEPLNTYCPRNTREVDLLIQASDCVVDPEGTQTAKLIKRQFLGDEYLYELEVDTYEGWQAAEPVRVLALCDACHCHQMGETVSFNVKPDRLSVYPRAS